MNHAVDQEAAQQQQQQQEEELPESQDVQGAQQQQQQQQQQEELPEWRRPDAYANLPEDEEPPFFPITLRFLDGEECELEVTRRHATIDVMEWAKRYRELDHLDIRQIRIVHNSRHVTWCLSLDRAGITEGAILYVVIADTL